MRGLMMDTPLLISSLMDHAAAVFPDQEIVTLTVEGAIHRYTWTDAHLRSRRLSEALHTLGIHDGDAVATLAWNTHRHLELCYGVSGMGAVHAVAQGIGFGGLGKEGLEMVLDDRVERRRGRPSRPVGGRGRSMRRPRPCAWGPKESPDRSRHGRAWRQ